MFRSGLSDNPTLLVAVVVSLILAGILSFFGLFIFFYALYNAFIKFSKDNAHMASYTSKYEHDWRRQQEEIKSQSVNLLGYSRLP